MIVLMFFVIFVLFVAIHGNYGVMTGDVPCCSQFPPGILSSRSEGPKFLSARSVTVRRRKLFIEVYSVLSFQRAGELLDQNGNGGFSVLRCQLSR